MDQGNVTVQERASGGRRRLLVVDDMPEICEFFRALLGRARHLDVALTTEVESARALELLRRERFDVVVSDFRMRDVDGAAVLRAARASNPDGVRVMMTGYNEIPTDIDRLLEAGVDAYVQKPLRSQDLLLLLLDLLHRNDEALAACRAHARELEALAVQESRHAEVRNRE